MSEEESEPGRPADTSRHNCENRRVAVIHVFTVGHATQSMNTFGYSSISHSTDGLKPLLQTFVEPATHWWT